MAAGSSWTTPAVNFACCTCGQGRAPHNEERPGIPNDLASRLQVDLRSVNTNGCLKNKAREFQMDFARKKALRLKATVSKKNERKYSREIHDKFTRNSPGNSPRNSRRNATKKINPEPHRENCPARDKIHAAKYSLALRGVLSTMSRIGDVGCEDGVDGMPGRRSDGW